MCCGEMFVKLSHDFRPESPPSFSFTVKIKLNSKYFSSLQMSRFSPMRLKTLQTKLGVKKTEKHLERSV